MIELPPPASVDPLSDKTRDFLCDEIRKHVPAALIVRTIENRDESTVEIHLPSHQEMRRMKNLCEGYFGTTLEDSFQGISLPALRETSAKIMSVAEILADQPPARSFIFPDNENRRHGAWFINEFGGNLQILTRDRTRCEKLPEGTPYSSECLKSLGPGWQHYLGVEEEVHEWRADAKHATWSIR